MNRQKSFTLSVDHNEPYDGITSDDIEHLRIVGRDEQGDLVAVTLQPELTRRLALKLRRYYTSTEA